MKTLITLSALVLCASAVAQPAERPTIVLHLEGSANQVNVTSAWHKAHAFRTPLRHEPVAGRIRLLDPQGAELEHLHFDLSTFHLDRNNPEPVFIGRSHLLMPGISCLVKIPDFGESLGSLEISRIEAGKTLLMGRISATALAKVVARSTIAPHAAPTVKTHLKNGPLSNRYDIVILGDGYLQSDQARFYNDIAKWMNNLFAKEPFKSYRHFFNVHSVFRASKERGADNPRANPPIYKNTVYDASYWIGGTERCLYIKNQAQASKDAALAPDVEGRVVVFVNSPKYGGCASRFAVSYNGSLGSEVQSHEFGHSYGGLADEYGGNNNIYTGPEPGQPNVTKDKTCSKWSLWKGTNGVGCFEGGRYYNRGIYRPKQNCLMRALNVPLCPICVEEMTKDGYTTVNPIENPAPASTLVTIYKPGSKTFGFTNLVPGNRSIQWLLDNKVVHSGSNAFSFTLSTASLSPGLHNLRVELTDRTALVRKDPTKKLRRTHTWAIDVRDARSTDLTVTAVSAPPGSNWQAGAVQSVTVTTRNLGTSPAPASTTTLHLSTSSTPSRSSYLLWTQSVPSLGPGASYTRTAQFVNPRCWFSTQNFYVSAFADGLAEIPEANESNNGRSVATPRPLGRYQGTGRTIEYDSPRAGNTQGAFYTEGATWSASKSMSARVCAIAPRHPGAYVVFVMSAQSSFSYDTWSALSIGIPLFRPILGRVDARGTFSTLQTMPAFQASTSLTSFVHSLWFSPTLSYLGPGSNSLSNQIRP